MGLYAGFAEADFKPMCGEKIGLVYHPSFMVHILFVRPTNYMHACYRPLFLSCFLSCTQNREQRESDCDSANQI